MRQGGGAGWNPDQSPPRTHYTSGGPARMDGGGDSDAAGPLGPRAPPVGAPRRQSPPRLRGGVLLSPLRHLIGEKTA